DTTAKILTVTVASVADAPQGITKSITIAEDALYSVTAADFGFSDPHDDPTITPTAPGPKDSFVKVRITSLPTAGTLLNNGLALQAGQEISLNNLGLTYQPPANVNTVTGTLTGATIGFQVIDGGSPVNGGVNVDQT